MKIAAAKGMVKEALEASGFNLLKRCMAKKINCATRKKRPPPPLKASKKIV